MSESLKVLQEMLKKISVGQGAQSIQVKDDKAKDEACDYDSQKIKQALLDQEQDRDERKKYANKIFFLIVWWLVGVGILLLLNGFSEINVNNVLLKFHLSDGILIAVISGTTVNILGIFVIVAKYLFHRTLK